MSVHLRGSNRREKQDTKGAESSAFKMELRALTPVFFTSQQIYFPYDLIVYLSNFLGFKDFRNFTRALSASGKEHEIFRKDLWRMSTHQFHATFLNRKSLEIEYNFDPERPQEDWVLINVQSLLPVLNGIVSPGLSNFESIFKINNFLYLDAGINMCSLGRHAGCDCHSPNDPESVEIDGPECEHSHFHHYCVQHIKMWLRLYLLHSILLRESRQLYNEIINTTWGGREAAYLQEDHQANPEFWLISAQAKGEIWYYQSP